MLSGVGACGLWIVKFNFSCIIFFSGIWKRQDWKLMEKWLGFATAWNHVVFFPRCDIRSVMWIMGRFV